MEDVSLILLVSCSAEMTDQIHQHIDESASSRAMYFSWINHAWEGTNEEQTLVNLDFFKWLRDEYGIQLDIYLLDAGNIDGWRFYGSMDLARFKEKFPNVFDRIYEKAKSIGCRLGIWLGPNGYGENPEDAQARIDTLVKLCRDYNMALFKFDACASDMRPEKEKYFIKALKECRTYSPDLIVLNHRINFTEETALHHGVEGAYAAIRVDGKQIGASDRSVGFPSNTWEYPVRTADRNYTYYVPLTKDMVGKNIDVVVLGLKDDIKNINSEVWITTYNIPFEERELVLYVK